jgi:dienelactone hydrolase
MVRVSTIREVLDFVYDEARINALIGISLDYTRVSIIGHSFGGTTAIYSSMVDKRITGVCIAYDPCLYILDENQSYESMTIPVYCINADEFYRTLYPYMHNDRRLEELYEGLRSPGL